MLDVSVDANLLEAGQLAKVEAGGLVQIMIAAARFHLAGRVAKDLNDASTGFVVVTTIILTVAFTTTITNSTIVTSATTTMNQLYRVSTLRP